MDIEAAQELMTAIGAGAGVVALCWNGWASWRSRSIKRSTQIQVSTDGTGSNEIVTVSFTGAETHTSYYLTVKCRRPRKLHARIFSGWPMALYDTGERKELPIDIKMKTARDTPTVTTASFIPEGHPLKSALVLTFEVRQQYASKVVARRKLAVTFG